MPRSPEVPNPDPDTVTVGLLGSPPKVTPPMVGLAGYGTVPLKVVPSTFIWKLSPGDRTPYWLLPVP